MSARRGWRSVPEAGTIFGIRFVAWLLRFAGRTVVSAFLYVLCMYYALVRSSARKASRDYLSRIGLPARFRDVVRHLRHFAEASADRALFVTGHFRSLQIEHHGHEHIVKAAESGTGALLLGAHLGSFEAMRTLADHHQVPIHVVIDNSNAELINRVLSTLSPTSNVRVISLAPKKAGDSVEGATSALSTVLSIKGAIARGELVAILADRHDEAAERTVTTQCFGAPATFPSGPWILAHSLGCPVYFVAGLYQRPNRYDLYCEPLSTQVRLLRGKREESMHTYVSHYAELLEKHAKLAPYNWFNFYDFWSQA